MLCFCTVLFATCDGATDPTRVMEHAERTWKCKTNNTFYLWRYSKCKTILVWPDGTETTCDGATDPTRVVEHTERTWKCKNNNNFIRGAIQNVKNNPCVAG